MFIIVFNQIFPGTKPFYTTLFAEEEEEEEKIMQQQQQRRDCFRSPLKELRFLFFCVCVRETERDRERTANRELQCLASTLQTCLI
jgi:hypothetical protein